MFLDEAKIYVKGGDGGAGAVAFRREKYVPRGGPAGGDGGKGGDVVFVVNPRLNTLSKFQRQVHFRAANGQPGGNFNRFGAAGQDLEIEVPPGTIVRDAESGELLADLTQEGQRFVVARGGRGGRGNARFKSSTNQAPRMAEKGEPGDERWVTLELKLLADVGLVGVPNAGKSTLISVISAARPKIAPYPFTTLEPSLGVATVGDREIVFADIPGLVEGAHAGVGLGHSFLRHVQRTRLLVHLLDGAGENPIGDFVQINTELALFDPNLAEKPQIVVLNKMDLPDAQARWPEVERAVSQHGYPVMAISAVTHQGVQELLNRVAQMMAELPETRPTEEVPVFRPDEEEVPFRIFKVEEGVYRVTGERIERAVAMTYWEYEEAVMRFQRILRALGITEALEKAGIEEGDTVIIGDMELEWAE
ncbi:MAG: GTPase ObgE [Aggregatilineales bacterium]|mgnify:FL=1|nr:GTPase ObgE [Chloroflexota bacterium]